MTGIRRRARGFGAPETAAATASNAAGSSGGAREARAAGRRVRLPRPGPRLMIATVVVLAALAGGYLWLRNSSLAAVTHVRVTGLSGPEASQIGSALRTAATGISTLDVHTTQLHNAVAPYPEVKSLRVSASFPHSLTIRVIEQNPIAVVVAAGHRTAVSGDGTLLSNLTPSASAPTISVSVPPGGTHLTGAARQAAELLADAPSGLLSRVSTVSDDPTHGLTVSLRNGPELYFGGGDSFVAKWDSVISVLTSSSSAGAGYIDVTVPGRPAAGPGR